MTFSEIHGKPTNSLSEDLLTSDVFGSCYFASYSNLLKCILEEAVHFESKKKFITKRDVVHDEYFFWPRFRIDNLQTEPDVFIILWHSQEDCSLIIIESKYRSDKSSEPDYNCENITDQLARELLILENKDVFSQISPKLKTANVISKSLFYITVDDILPEKSIAESASEFMEKMKLQQNYSLPFYWIPWWKIESSISIQHQSNSAGFKEKRIIKHVIDVLNIKGFKRFNGFDNFQFNKINFQYTSEYEGRINNYIFDFDFRQNLYQYKSV